ncbi:MAG: polysaccharide biosynthesis tyrosine autokinase [Flavobacteriaceae bacterium]
MNNQLDQFDQDDNEINLLEELKYYLFFWPYYLLCVFLTVIIATLYLYISQPIYETTSQIQIKKSETDSALFLTEDLSDLFGKSKIVLENEIAVMNSNNLLGQVIDKLDLQTRVQEGPFFNRKNLYNGSIPFNMSFDPNVELESVELKTEKDKAFLTIDSLVIPIIKGETLVLDGWSISPKETLFEKETVYHITRISKILCLKILRETLEVTSNSDAGDVINILYSGSNIELNEQVVNTLVELLEKEQVSDKRQISKISIDFIEERLSILSKSIDTISKKTISYQTSNALFDPSLQTGNALSNLVKDEERNLTLEIQKEIALDLLKTLNSQKSYDLLPIEMGIESHSIIEFLKTYNELIIQRKNLLSSSTEENPLVQQINNQLDDTRTAMISGMKKYINGLNISLLRYNEIQNQRRESVASLPEKESAYKGLTRNFELIEQLYLFLLQRKEEASISYVSALSDVKILSQAITDPIPISPRKKIIYLSSLVLGILLPSSILFVLRLLDTKINTREDLEKGINDVKIVGEIPFETVDKKSKNAREITTEAMRVLRSNLAYVLKNQKSLVITCSSSIKGEGKSFISYHLAQSYASLGNKVILVGADLRNPQIHKFLEIKRPLQGLTTYLSNFETKDYKKWILNFKNDKVDYLFSGAIPPNPSELLASSDFKDLIETLKKEYHYVVLDSSPLMLVSDTNSLLPLSDLLLYVTRAQHTDKRVFGFINEIQSRDNIPPFSFVLNGILGAGPKSSFYKYNYAYRYSYRYKYNYGYGYGYEADNES